MASCKPFLPPAFGLLLIKGVFHWRSMSSRYSVFVCLKNVCFLSSMDVRLAKYRILHWQLLYFSRYNCILASTVTLETPLVEWLLLYTKPVVLWLLVRLFFVFSWFCSFIVFFYMDLCLIFLSVALLYFLNPISYRKFFVIISSLTFICIFSITFFVTLIICNWTLFRHPAFSVSFPLCLIFWVMSPSQTSFS